MISTHFIIIINDSFSIITIILTNKRIMYQVLIVRFQKNTLYNKHSKLRKIIII